MVGKYKATYQSALVTNKLESIIEAQFNNYSVFESLQIFVLSIKYLIDFVTKIMNFLHPLTIQGNGK